MKCSNVNVEIFAAGDGINYPKKGQTVILHYSGYVHGKIFDSVRLQNKFDFSSFTPLTISSCFQQSRQRDKPFKFKLYAEQVIPGLEEGISQLSIGEQAKISIPSAKAYGSRGFPGLIPKNSDLVFDVELLDFN
jgi:FKBP-type peptidyl-prolyl cis-trans isomerase